MSNVDISRIRSAFSKATVVVHNDGISVIYRNTGNWFTQSKTETLAALRQLIGISDGFSIIISEGQSISLSFMIPGMADRITFYQPTEHEFVYDTTSFNTENVVDEVKDILREYAAAGEKKALSEVFQWYMDKNQPNMSPDLGTIGRFLKMKPIAHRIVNRGFICEVRYDANETGLGTYSVDFSISTNDHIPRMVSGELQNLFIQLLSLSKEITIEVNAEIGVLNLYFFS